MITNEDKEKANAKLSIPELTLLRDISKELESFVEKHEEISIEGLHTLIGVVKSLDIAKDGYLLKVLNLLKQGNELV